MDMEITLGVGAAAGILSRAESRLLDAIYVPQIAGKAQIEGHAVPA